MSASSIIRLRVVLLLTKGKIPPLLASARAIYAAMLANAADFPAPNPALVELLAQIAALDTAQQAAAAKPHALDAVPTRNSARDALWTSLQNLRGYVQLLADAAGEGAVVLVKSSGMNIGRQRVVNKPILQVKLTATPGVVVLIGNASMLRGTARRAGSYLWQYSLDGGHTWILGDGTAVAHATITGLPLMTNCFFRVAAVLGGVTGEWSAIVPLVVH